MEQVIENLELDVAALLELYDEAPTAAVATAIGKINEAIAALKG